MDDGLIQLSVLGKGRDGLRTRVIEGGILKERKGVNLPGVNISAATFTDKDRTDLLFGIKMGVDYIALSFVRTGRDIERVKDWLTERAVKIPIIAKIEKPDAVRNIDAILEVADGLMVARGDLGVEVPAEEVPLLQKDLIERANRCMKPVITATQMLESMTEHLRPTRAEVTDVANAVLDGTDALMLSAETASGKYPTEAVRMMDRIIRYTEERGLKAAAHSMKGSFPGAVAEGACTAAIDIGAKAIVVFTRSGFTALLASKFRPPVPIIALTTKEDVRTRMTLFWGVIPRLMRPVKNTDQMILEVERNLLMDNLAKKGDKVVIMASSPLSTREKTNFMKLHVIGEDRGSGL